MTSCLLLFIFLTFFCPSDLSVFTIFVFKTALCHSSAYICLMHVFFHPPGFGSLLSLSTPPSVFLISLLLLPLFSFSASIAT